MIILMAIQNESEKAKAENLYNKYSRLLMYISSQIIKDEHLAQDAVSEAFIKIINNLHKIDEVDSDKTKAFIVVICRNVCFSNLKKLSKYNSDSLDESDEIIDNNQDILDTLTTNEAVEKVMKSLNNLKLEYADLLRLRIIYNYNDKQLAELLGISHDCLRSRLTRARKALKRLLDMEECNV